MKKNRIQFRSFIVNLLAACFCTFGILRPVDAAAEENSNRVKIDCSSGGTASETVLDNHDILCAALRVRELQNAAGTREALLNCFDKNAAETGKLRCAMLLSQRDDVDGDVIDKFIGRFRSDPAPLARGTLALALEVVSRRANLLFAEKLPTVVGLLSDTLPGVAFNACQQVDYSIDSVSTYRLPKKEVFAPFPLVKILGRSGEAGLEKLAESQFVCIGSDLGARAPTLFVSLVEEWTQIPQAKLDALQQSNSKAAIKTAKLATWAWEIVSTRSLASAPGPSGIPASRPAPAPYSESGPDPNRFFPTDPFALMKEQAIALFVEL